jgi:hypothetical protein
MNATDWRVTLAALTCTVAVSLAARSFADSDLPQAMRKAASETGVGAVERTGSGAVAVTFMPGSAALGEGEQNALKAALKTARDEHPRAVAVVVAWSDKALPRSGEKLASADITLAEQRARNVEKVLLDLGVEKITFHTMAQGPNWLSRKLDTADAKLKRAATGAAASAGEPRDPALEQTIRVVASAGGPGRVIVAFPSLDNTAVAH